jgi:hypothetical protein
MESPLMAAIPEAPKNPEDPTATMGMLCARLAGAITQIIAAARSATNIFILFINLLLSSR